MSETAKIKVTLAEALPLGAWITHSGLRFAVDMAEGSEETKLRIFDKKNHKLICEVVMNDYTAMGSVAAVHMTGLDAGEIYYQYMRGRQVVEDPYGARLFGSREWGTFKVLEERAVYEPCEMPAFGAYPAASETAFEDLVLYKLHVRGFTNHSSSKVANRGTFEGVAKKAAYFKELGINGLVLMPVTDFPELSAKMPAPSGMPPTLPLSMYESGRQQDMQVLSHMAGQEEAETLLNYWGYGRSAFFAPKGAYAHKDPVEEFKAMVHCLHQENIQVFLELLFTDDIPQTQILDCLRHWVGMYQVDGFWLNGEVVPMEMAAKDPLLRHVKLICAGMDARGAYADKLPQKKRLGCANDDFLYVMRDFLKGDEGCIKDFVQQSTHVDLWQVPVHYITNNNGFTLADLVSYNDKHNEANGEDNRDGSDFNHSWNCGAEGKTRSKKVMALRKKQMYNAMTLLLLSQGVPMLYAGDEFGNSQQGNNNAYNQDNEISWLDWRDIKKNKDHFEYVKALLKLRREHPVFRSRKAFRGNDYLSCGIPDLSIHGQMPWHPNFDREQRYVGIMYCGEYSRVDGGPDASFYIAYNMHWDPTEVALPPLPKGWQWELMADTSAKRPFEPEPEAACEEPAREAKNGEEPLSEMTAAEAPRAVRVIRGRSIQIFQSVPKP